MQFSPCEIPRSHDDSLLGYSVVQCLSKHVSQVLTASITRAIMMEAVLTSETSVYFNETT
jgi:hypothetical protein